MATDRDEQQRQQQELEEIRRSFAEMGARMGSLFEPAETDEHQGGASPPVLPPAPPVERRRPSWRLVAAAVVLLLVGTAFGWVLAPDGSDSPAPVASPTTAVVPTTTANHGDQDRGQRARAVRGDRRAGGRGHLPSEPQCP